MHFGQILDLEPVSRSAFFVTDLALLKDHLVVQHLAQGIVQVPYGEPAAQLAISLTSFPCMYAECREPPANAPTARLMSSVVPCKETLHDRASPTCSATLC